MSRPATGDDQVLMSAREAITSAQTVEPGVTMHVWKVNRKANEINDLPTPLPRQCCVYVPPVIGLKTRGPPAALAVQ